MQLCSCVEREKKSEQIYRRTETTEVLLIIGCGCAKANETRIHNTNSPAPIRTTFCFTIFFSSSLSFIGTPKTITAEQKMKYIFIRITAKIHEIAAKSYIFALSFYFVNLFYQTLLFIVPGTIFFSFAIYCMCSQRAMSIEILVTHRGMREMWCKRHFLLFFSPSLALYAEGIFF